MRRLLIIALATLLGLCTATRELEAVMFGGIDFPAGTISFADAVSDYSPGTGVGDPFDNSSRSLGEPDGSNVSLGNGGQLVLQFTDNFLTPSGNSTADLWIFELGTFESVDISISQNGNDWFGGAATVDGQGIDIDGFAGVTVEGKYGFVRLIDAGGALTEPDHAGADIDAVGAISTLPVPEPASVLLMGTGLAGLLAYIRKG